MDSVNSSTHTITSLNDLDVFAFLLSHTLKGGDIVALKGEMGAGKTTLTQFLAKHLGCVESITSPTYVLVKTYPMNSNTIQLLCHMDAWRLDEHSNLSSVIDEEELGHPHSLAIIEWPERITLTTQPSVVIEIKKEKGSEQRTITLTRVREPLTDEK